MMGLNLRKLAAVVSAAAMLAVAGPVAVSTANAADAPAASETAAQHVFATFHYGNGDYGIPNNFNTAVVAVDKGASLKDAAAKAEAQYGQPKNEGNVFAGWSSDGLAALDGSTPIDGDVDLYPVFVKAATVTFNGLDAAAGYTREVTLKSGSTFSQFVDELKKTTSLPTPPEEGYELVFKKVVDGVKTDLKGDEPVTDGFEVSVEFAKKPVETVTVTFYMDESPSSLVYKEVKDVEKGKTTFAELAKQVGTPTREGKVFVGWTAAGVDGVISPDSTETFRWDRAFFAVWKDAAKPVAKYTIVFHDAYGQGSNFKVEGVEAGTPSDRVAAKAPVPAAQSGQRFVGWSLAGGVALPELVTGDLDVYPVFEPVEVKVNVVFHDRFGNPIANIDGLSGQTSQSFVDRYQAEHGVPDAPWGQKFVGWSLKDGVALPELVTGDLDVYPLFKYAAPSFPWSNWWFEFIHWWGSWNHGFWGWTR